MPCDNRHRYLARSVIICLIVPCGVLLARPAASATDEGLGVLLGLRYPAHASPEDRVRYQTLWIVVSADSAALVGRANGIVVPRPVGGFWQLAIDSAGWRGQLTEDGRECSSHGWRRTQLKDAPVRLDSLVAHPLGRTSPPPSALPEDIQESCCIQGAQWSRMMTLQHAAPSYVTVKIEEQGWCGGNSPEGFARYVLSRLDDTDHAEVPLEHFWPADGKAAYRRAAERFNQETNASNNEPPGACASEPNVSNWGVSRARGSWEVVGYQNYVSRICAPNSGDFVIPLEPPHELAANDKLGVPWGMVETAVPGAVDAISGPRRSVLAAVTADTIRLYRIENGRLGGSLGSVAIRSDRGAASIASSLAIVSAEWAVGGHVQEWTRALASSLR